MDYTDPKTWIAIAFFAFFILFGKMIWRFLAGALDAHAVRVSAELTQAENLRREAEEMLGHYKQKFQESMQEADAIIQRARTSAESLRAQAVSDMKEGLDRRMRQADDRMREEEKRAVADIRSHMVELAVQAATALMTAQAAQSSTDRAVPLAIAALQRQVH